MYDNMIEHKTLCQRALRRRGCTVDSLLTDTSIRRTPRVGPCLFYSLYLILYKTDTSLRRTLSAGPKGVRLRES